MEINIRNKDTSSCQTKTRYSQLVPGDLFWFEHEHTNPRSLNLMTDLGYVEVSSGVSGEGGGEDVSIIYLPLDQEVVMSNELIWP